MPITCSFIYGVVDLPSGILLYINAGHPVPLISNPASTKCRSLAATTMLLGVQGGVRTESCHQFGRNDRLVLYTDGLSETRNDHEMFFGDQRIEKIVAAHTSQSAEVLIEAVFQEVDTFRKGAQEDDETLVVIDFEHVQHRGF